MPPEDNGGTTNNPPNQDEKPIDVVKKEDHQKVLDQLQSASAKAKDAEKRVNELAAEVEALKKKGASSNEDYKALFEESENKRKGLETQLSQTSQKVAMSEKYKALSKALLAAGMKKEALQEISHDDLRDLQIEESENGWEISGVELVVDRIKSKRGYLFDVTKPANINTSTGTGLIVEGQKITPEYIVALEKTDPKKARELSEIYVKNKKGLKLA